MQEDSQNENIEDKLDDEDVEQIDTSSKRLGERKRDEKRKDKDSKKYGDNMRDNKRK